MFKIYLVKDMCWVLMMLLDCLFVMMMIIFVVLGWLYVKMLFIIDCKVVVVFVDLGWKGKCWIVFFSGVFDVCVFRWNLIWGELEYVIIEICVLFDVILKVLIMLFMKYFVLVKLLFDRELELLIIKIKLIVLFLW